MISILTFLFAVFISSVSQLLLKISANKKHSKRLKEYLNKYVITAYTLFLISTFIAIISLRGIKLKGAPILESAGYIYILLLSKIFLQEKINRKRILGVGIIVIGIAIFYYQPY